MTWGDIILIGSGIFLALSVAVSIALLLTPTGGAPSDTAKRIVQQGADNAIRASHMATTILRNIGGRR